MDISGKTRLLAVIGDPVEHSLSPRIMNHFIRCSGVDYAYMAFRVKRGEVAAFLRAAQLLGIAGCNITMPLKEETASLATRLDGDAKVFGNINVLAAEQGGFTGYNADAPGFLCALGAAGRENPGRVLILGAGSVAKTIAIALVRSGASVTVCARRLEQASALASALGAGTASCAFAGLAAQCERADVLVNATPLGMAGMPQDFEDFAFVDALPRHALVFDLIYAPRQTRLLAHASARALDTQNGLDHLVAQAAISFELFTGIMPDASMLSSLCL